MATEVLVPTASSASEEVKTEVGTKVSGGPRAYRIMPCRQLEGRALVRVSRRKGRPAILDEGME